MKRKKSKKIKKKLNYLYCKRNKKVNKNILILKNKKN